MAKFGFSIGWLVNTCNVTCNIQPYYFLSEWSTQKSVYEIAPLASIDRLHLTKISLQRR